MHFVPPTRVLSPVSEDPTPEDLNRPKISTLWFPPPPPLPPSVAPPIVEETKKTKKSSKFSPPSVPSNQKRSNFRHSVGQSTKARRKRLQGTQLPAIKLTLQHWILLCLLILSFIILICGFIFAGCVALPHTDHTDAVTNDNNSTYVSGADDSFPYEITVFRRQQDPPANVLYSATPQATGLPQLNDILQAGSAEEAGDALTAAEGAANTTTTTTTTTTDPAGAVGNTTTTPTSSTSSTAQPTDSNTTASYESEAKRLGYDSPKNLTILFLYIATLPLLTILHTTIILISLCRTRRHTSTSSSTTSSSLSRSNSTSSTSSSDSTDFIAKLKARAAQTHAPPPKPSILSTVTKSLALLTPLVLTLSWTILNGVQLHCEIHPPSSSSSSNKAICPIQIQTHSMRGIHELSIARNVFGWLVIAVYAFYCVWVVRDMVVKRKEERKRRGEWEVEERREEMLRETRLGGIGREKEERKEGKGTVAVVRFAAQRDLDLSGTGNTDGNEREKVRALREV